VNYLLYTLGLRYS